MASKEEKVQKELKVKVRPGTAMFEIYFDNGGEMPRDLMGNYTSEREAKIAINTYLLKKNRKCQ